MYERAEEEVRSLGTTLIDDPFAGSGFAELRQPTPPLANFDPRGFESLPYDLQKYLDRLGPNAAIKTVEEGRRFRSKGRSELHAELASVCRCSPQAKAKYLGIFEDVFAKHQLDAMVMPQMRKVRTRATFRALRNCCI